jgi:hypothetical protein
MDRGAAAREKNGANNLAKHDRDNQVPKPIFPPSSHSKKPYRAWAWTVRAENRQEALDTEGSFRDGFPGDSP